MTAILPRLCSGRFMFVAAAMVCLSVSPWAMGQQRAGSDGHALDANPQAGSGGNNRIEGQVDYGARNDVVTGNVTGGRGFRGDVGYRAPGEFGDSLGTDDLFDFQARSYNSAPSTPPGYLGGGGGGAVGGPVSVYREFTDVPRNRLGGGAGAGQFNGDYSSLGAGGTSGLQVQRDSLRATGGFTPALTNPDQTFGRGSNAQGQAVELTASPLLGVRQQTLQAQPVQPDLSTEAGGDADQPVDSQYAIPGQDTGQDRDTPEQANRLDGALDSQGNRVPELADRGRDIDQPAPSDQVAPSLVLGQRLQTRLGAGGQPQTLDQQLARIQSRIFRPLDQRVTNPGTDPYLDILRRIRGDQPEQSQNQNQPGAENGQPQTAQGTDQVQDQNQSQDQGDTDQDAGKPAWLQAMEAPDEQTVEEAERRRDQAVNQQGANPGGQTENQTADQAQEQAQAEQLQAFLDSLDYDAPRLKTLVGQRQDRVARQMRRGQEALSAGKFFDAEGAFRRVLSDEPDNPLGRVGLVHAQLAAGLIRSAALNLRKLFEEHPELIAAKYDQNLLPPADRLQWLQGELSGMIDKNNFSADPGLMMAYLGYQVDSRQLIRYGLAVAQARAPRDKLMPVLHRIWLGKRSQNADKAQGGAAGGKPVTP